MFNKLNNNDNLKLIIQRQQKREKEFKEEKKILIDNHEIRLRQLIQETVDTRFVVLNLF